jgi:ankyrin repeat protein
MVTHCRRHRLRATTRSSSGCSRGGADVDAQGGSTPLHSAAANGHLDVVKFLVAQQAEVNAKETDGWTPLHLAARYGYLDIVKFLVERC